MVGSKRLITGNQLEQAVQTVLLNKGFEIVRYNQWKKNPEKYGTELLLKNVPFRTIYHHRGNTEFLLQSEKKKLEIRIECKWQQVSGSVDEKLPYLYLNALEAMPEEVIMILIDGGGWKEGAITWLRDAVLEKKYSSNKGAKKKIIVYNLAEFFTWANNTF